MFLTNFPFYKYCIVALSVCLLVACGGGSNNDSGPNLSPSPSPPPTRESAIDLLGLSTDEGFFRLQGATGSGKYGLPVAGGYDMNGDGHKDYAMASMLASPQGRTSAGQVALVLGDGNVNGTLDSALGNSRLIIFLGDGNNENTGSEIWMGDVTGDGLSELLIARQNYRADSPDRIGAGALSLIIGNNQLTALATTEDSFDLRNPSGGINVLTLVGADTLDRLGIWMRIGDIDGDDIDDFAVGADQTDTSGSNAGTVYVVRGGPHLDNTQTVDLANLDASNPLAPYITRIVPPAGSDNFHFGATLTLADLDNNGRAELMIAATINRAGAALLAEGAPDRSAQGSGGAPLGRMYILWDDNLLVSSDDPQITTITADNTAPGSITTISGADTSDFLNAHFGEELLGGLDYDDDGNSDLFVGDIAGDPPQRRDAGLGHVFFNAAELKGLSFDMNTIPTGFTVTTIYGPEVGAISSDTALHGDFDNDGIDDLATASPHAAPFGRTAAGTIHILWGRRNWPALIDLATPSDSFSITNIYGGHGTDGDDIGDTLAYSAAAGDIDNDGQVDLITNEMVGNGAGANAVDVGNLIIISGATVAQSNN